MYYLSQQNGNKPEEMSAFLSALFKTVLTGQNFTKADYYYSKLRNILDTDISAFDFSDSTASVQQFIQLFSEKEPEIVRSPDEL